MNRFLIAKQAKVVTSQVSLLALGATFELASRYVEAMQKEIADLGGRAARCNRCAAARAVYHHSQDG